MDQLLRHCTSKVTLPPVDSLVLLLCTTGNFLRAGDPNTSETMDINAAADGCIPSKLPASPNSHLVWVTTLKSYENIQPQTQASAAPHSLIFAHSYIWGWPELLQLAAPEKKTAEWIVQVNYVSGNICDIFIPEKYY